MAFQEKLKLEFSLTIGGESFSIPGGQVKHFAVRLANHGFTASVSFWTALEKADAPLFVAFKKNDLIQVRLSVAGVYPTEVTPPGPLVVQGLVRARSLAGLSHGPHEGEERAFRLYSLEFADPAQVLWRQHRPTELHTQKKLVDLLDAHKGPLTLSYDWDVLQAEQPLLCLALGSDDRRTSFYDFVLWFVHTRNGVWTYDSQQDQYVLSDSKSSSGRAAVLDSREVERMDVQVQLPAPIRHGARVLNALANGPTAVALAQDQAAQGISHDVLLRTPIASEAEQRQTLEKSRLKLRQRRLQVTFQQFPTVAVHPGALLRLQGFHWLPDLRGTGEDLRVLALDLELRALRQGPYDEQQSPDAGYSLEMSALLEQKTDPVPTLPAYRAPRYPLYVEGKVHSPGGQETDRSWFVVEDDKTSVSNYRVTVPLWNKTVSVPAQPHFFSGHFYFPPYKNERVLLALHFDRAELHRFLDWGETVRLPQDGQGDQMLLGKNKTSQTAITHDYQEANPVWNLQRVSAGDTQTVRISEGNLLIKVEEKQGVAPASSTYDVTPQVEAAKGDLALGVGGAIGETTTAYQGAVANVKGRIEAATTETVAALESARAEVKAKVSAAKAALSGALSGMSGKAAPLSSAAAEAKVALGKLR
ncbi:hypothetical protein JQX13_44165 [Archangium violaceum]|uniref:hypothetical protein n=1 Tax=Archangium violaceum TaxID=83451 RepID=UPI00193B203E|nr:hypothetical protein [Archangium violaceum]QRK06986.1 hypothetical protein JQX13_44165 [Archangium violaceum]